MNKVFIKYIIVLISLFTWVSDAESSHIIGGDITYEHIMGDTYEIRFTFRRDCFTGDPEAQFDNQAVVWIFDDNGYLLQQYGIGGRIIMNLNPDDTLGKTFRSDCGFEGEQVCVQETTYKKRVRLPYRPGKGGYTLAYQRCCRNNTLANILEPDDTGGTWLTYLSEDALATQNSSPEFDVWPDIYICTDEDINFTLGATDKDGDSLVYKLYTPLAGLSDDKPVPFGPPYAPYSNVEWKSPFSLNNLLGGEPLTINSKTGHISGIPNQVGQYLVGVVVEEYRNGKLLGFTRRDFQYNVRVCVDPPSAAFTANDGVCEGKTVSFKNNSVSATGYRWNFNYPSEDPQFMSTEENPTFTYPEEGVYQVELVSIRNVDGCSARVVQSIPALVGNIDVDFRLLIDECRSDGTYMISLTDTSKDQAPGLNIASRVWNITQNGETRTSTSSPAEFIVSPGTFMVDLISTSESGCSGSKTESINTDQFEHKAAYKHELVQCPESDVAIIKFINTSNSINPYDISENVNWTITTPEGVVSGAGNEITVTTGIKSILEIDMEVDFGGGCKAFLDDRFDVSQALPRISYSYKGQGCPDFETVVVDFAIEGQSKGFDLNVSNTKIFNKDGEEVLSTGDKEFSATLEKNSPIRLVIYGEYSNGCRDTLDETFVPGPFADITFTANPRKICVGDTLALLKDGNSEWQYVWTPTENLYFATPGDGSTAQAIGVENTSYTVTVTDGICTEAATVDVEVLDGNNLMILGDKIVCDDNVRLTAQGGIPPGQFEWSKDADFSTIIYTGEILNTTLEGKEDNYYLRYTGETCGDDDVSALVQKRIFTLDVGGEKAEVCVGDTMLLLNNPSPDFTYVWEADPALIFKDGDMSKPYIIGITDRELTVTVSDGKCTETLKVGVDVHDKKDVVIKGSSQICEGADIKLSVEDVVGEGIFEWSTTPNFSEIAATGLEFNMPLTTEELNIYVRYTGGLCGDKDDEITVRRSVIDINFLPEPIRICKGDSVRLVVDPNRSYLYTWEPMTGLLFDPSDEVKANPLFIGQEDITYNVTVVDGECKKEYVVEVDVADTRTIAISGRDEVCDENVNLMASGADGNGTYQWSVSEDFATILSTGAELNTTLVGDSTTYYVRYTDQVCGSNVTSFKVKKYIFDLLYVEPFPVCYGDTIDYTVFNIGSGNVSYKWDDDPHIIDGADSGSLTIGIGTNEPDTIYLSFLATTESGCQQKETVRLYVKDRDTNDFTYKLTECGKYEVCFEVSEAYTGFVKWNFGDPGTTEDESIEEKVCYTYSQPGIYKVTLENLTSSCAFEPVEKNITINGDIVLNDIGLQQGCKGETITITPSSDNINLTYEWFSLDGTQLSNSTNLSINVNKPDTVIVKATDPNGCTGTDSIALAPYVYDVVPDFPSICSDDNYTLGLTINGRTEGFTYAWSPSSVIVSGGDTPNPVVSIIKDERVDVVITDTTTGCVLNESYLLSYVPLEINIDASPSAHINRGETLELSTTPSDANFTYEWSTGETSSSIEAKPEQDTMYSVKVTDENGCMDTDTINVKVRQPKCDDSDVFLPIAFTPNGDGVNDVLFVRSNFIESMELVIFNRWGQEVFRTTDQSKGWDGTYDGAKLQPDAFAYYLKVVCINKLEYAKQGNINLLK